MAEDLTGKELDLIDKWVYDTGRMSDPEAPWKYHHHAYLKEAENYYFRQQLIKALVTGATIAGMIGYLAWMASILKVDQQEYQDYMQQDTVNTEQVARVVRTKKNQDLRYVFGNNQKTR